MSFWEHLQRHSTPSCWGALSWEELNFYSHLQTALMTGKLQFQPGISSPIFWPEPKRKWNLWTCFNSALIRASRQPAHFNSPPFLLWFLCLESEYVNSLRTGQFSVHLVSISLEGFLWGRLLMIAPNLLSIWESFDVPICCSLVMK